MSVQTRLQIDTSFTEKAPSLNVSPQPKSPLSPILAAKPVNKPVNRARNESRKLLAHLLGQLQNRPTPHSFIPSQFNKRPDAKEKSRNLKPRLHHTLSDDEEDFVDNGVFTTDHTYELMTQLKEVIIVSTLQGWRIFHEDTTDGDLEQRHSFRKASASPFRLSRSSLEPEGRRSRSPSPGGMARVQAPELLSQCITIIASVVSEDCRFKMATPKPSRPPNALQSLTLDVAGFLLHTHRHDPKVISQIGFALIPAFASFQPEMHVRLLTFFEQTIIRPVLDELKEAQGGKQEAITESYTDEKPRRQDSNPPTISIQVDGAQDDLNSKPVQSWQTWTSANNTIVAPSTNAPAQDVAVYQLASLVPPLLAAILQSIDLTRVPQARIEVFHRFYQLVNVIVSLKRDAYLDILSIVAYHTSRARLGALGLLSTFWPKSIGHPVISKPLPIGSYMDSMKQITDPGWPKDNYHPYQFVPWRFMPKPHHSVLAASSFECRSCTNIVDGFGLMCPFTTYAVHFECYDYPEGNRLTEYTVSDRDTQKVAMTRFSTILPSRRDIRPGISPRPAHNYREVTMFTLALCFICREPIWGNVNQGLQCSMCDHYVHRTCATSPSLLETCGSAQPDSTHFTVDWDTLRRTCVEYHADILLSKERLAECTYEEVSIYHGVLWLQLQLLVNGIYLGSIVVTSKSKRSRNTQDHLVDEFELHDVIQWCEEYLYSDTPLPISLACEDYFQENGIRPSEHLLMFDWSQLAYTLSTIKSPYDIQKASHTSSSSDLLNVMQADPFASVDDSTGSSSTVIYEAATLAHMRDALGYEFNILSDTAAELFLSHLHHLGFYERSDRGTALFQDVEDKKAVLCMFPIPWGFDESVDVETLVCAVEACLLDLDLSVNEAGFLLLVRRLWPNGMTSEYASRRLAWDVVTWILAEDDNLAVILRDYLAKRQNLPGVRSATDVMAWPSPNRSRPTPTSSVNNGGDYIAARRLLLNYAVRWLSELYLQDTVAYAYRLYQFCLDSAKEIPDLSVPTDETTQKEKQARNASRCLRYMTKLLQASVVFEFDDIFVLWLDDAVSLGLCEHAIPALLRLFPRDQEVASQRISMIEINDTPVLNSVSGAVDPWRLAFNIASNSKEGLSRALHWLCLYACSGVNIPIPVFIRFSTLAEKFEAPLKDSLLLVTAALASLWLNSMGRQSLQAIFVTVFTRHTADIAMTLRQNGKQLDDTLRLIRQSLASLLLLFGGDRTILKSLSMILEIDIKGLPSRRKASDRASTAAPDPVVVDPKIMQSLEVILAADLDTVSCQIAKFLHMFIADSPFLEPHEIDNFILRNGRMLSTCAWKFYDIQEPEISGIRANLLIRVLVVDSQPFQTILQDNSLPNIACERRLPTMNRLFRILLDVTNPAFIIEDRQWRSCITEIFYHYFGAMWLDKHEQIRFTVETSSKTLLPAHFQAITLCWNEALVKSPISERLRMVSFLLHLRRYFPTWRMLDWDVIIETLLEDDYDQQNFGNEDGPASAYLSMYGLSSPTTASGSVSGSSEMLTAPRLRVSILALSMGMIAAGIDIDIFSLLKIKFYLAQMLGFQDVALVPSNGGNTFHVNVGSVRKLPESAYPCIHELVTVLDSPLPFDLPHSAMGRQGSSKSNLLVGSVFVDISLFVFSTADNLLDLPTLTLKSMLESLAIIIYKHDFDTVALKPLLPDLKASALKTLSILPQDGSYELRLLALTVCHAFIQKIPSHLLGTFVYESVIATAKLMSSQNQDTLQVQSKAFLDLALTKYAMGGLLNTLCKHPLDHAFFVVLQQITEADARLPASTSGSLREILLRDALTRAVENDKSVFDIVARNLHTYVDVVHHSDYKVDFLQFLGQHLTYLMRRISEWPVGAVDANSILDIASTVFQHNRPLSHELLPYLDTVLRTALTRLRVSTSSLSRLLRVTGNLNRRTQDESSTQASSHNLRMIVFEILGDGLKLKARVLPPTISAIIETINHHEDGPLTAPPLSYQQSFGALVDPAIYFLDSHVWVDMQSHSDFTASAAVARIVLNTALSRFNPIPGSTRAPESLPQRLGIRGWNMLVIVTLIDSSREWETMLFAHLPMFSYVHSACLRNNPSPTDINHSYIAIKLWLMLAQKVSEGVAIGTSASLIVWNELWPPFEALVNAFEHDIQVESRAISTVMTLTWSSVADLFLFVRSLRSPVALETSSHIDMLQRLQKLEPGESSTSKISRTLRGIVESSNHEVPFDLLVQQSAQDLVAAEKLRALDTPGSRPAPERTRRERETRFMASS